MTQNPLDDGTLGRSSEIAFVALPHGGKASGSISYPRLMSIAHVWLHRLGAAASAASQLGATPSGSAASAA